MSEELTDADAANREWTAMWANRARTAEANLGDASGRLAAVEALVQEMAHHPAMTEWCSALWLALHPDPRREGEGT